MRISKPLPMFDQYTLFCSPLEYTIIRAAVGGLTDLMECSPELFANNPKLLMLLSQAREMWKEMEETGRGHVSVQDPTVQAPSAGDQAHVPAVEEGTRVGAVVRSSNGQNQDGN